MEIIIIPSYRPTRILLDLVQAEEKKGHKVIVIDDGSGAAYEDIFCAVPFVLKHNINKGKGAAIKTALTYILDTYQKEALCDEISIVTMDSDGQHAVADVEKVLMEEQKHRDCLVLGSRDFSGKVPWKSKAGNLLTAKLFYLLYKRKLKDTQTGLRAFSYAMIPALLTISGSRYEYEMNVLSHYARNRLPIREVPIQTIYHDNKNSGTHFHMIKDSILIYKDVIKFTASSLSGFVVDYILFGIFLLLFGGFLQKVLISNILARFLSAAFNYTVNAKIVFKMKKATWKSAVQYFLLALFILCINNIILSTICSLTHLPAMVAKIITELILFIISFVIQRFFIFHNKNKSYKKK